MNTIAFALALGGGWDMLGPPSTEAAADTRRFKMLGERPQPAAEGDTAPEGAASAGSDPKPGGPVTGGPAKGGIGEAARPLPRRLVIYTAAWCGPCRAFEANVLPKLAAAGWRVGDGPDDHIRLADCTECLPAGVEALPTFVLLEGDREVKRHVGSLDAWGVGELVKGYSKRPAANRPLTRQPRSAAPPQARFTTARRLRR